MAPNEDNNIQKNARNIKPPIKNILFLIILFFFSFSETLYTIDKIFWHLILEIFLSDKNIIFIIIVI